MKKTFKGLSTIRTIYITMPRSTAAQTKTADPKHPKNTKNRTKKRTHFPKRPLNKKRSIEPKPCVLKGLTRKAASRPRAKKQPKNTKKRNPKRPKSFSGDFELCLRQLLALRASRAPTPATLCGLAWEQQAKEKTRGPREEPQKARSSES